MKKSIGTYGIIWALCVALFNVIVFVSPSEVGGMNKFGGAFWVGYVFITVAFAGQLLCAIFTFLKSDKRKVFYKIPLISISYGALVAMLIVGSLVMAIPNLPNWIGIIICSAILVFNAVAIVKATAAAKIVSGIDEKVAKQNLFIKKLAVDAENIVSSASSDELCSLAKKVYEEIRYSDPVSNTALAELDSQIERQLAIFANAIYEKDAELARENADLLTQLLENRNQKCKLLK